MVKLLLGIAAAVGASSLYSLGVALQAMEAKQTSHEHHLRLALAFSLLHRTRWLLGTGLSILGWPLQVVALLLAPLAVVQPALAAGLLVLMLLAQRMLHEHAGRREYLAMAAILLGVLGAAVTAPDRSTSHSDNLALTLVLVGLGVAGLAPYALQALGRRWTSLTMVGGGMCFAWSGVATKLASDDLANGRLLRAGIWGLSTAVASAAGLLTEASALQSRPAIQVAPVVFVTQTVVPVVLAPLLLNERFGATPWGGVPLVASLTLLVAGAALLVRSPLLLALMEGDPVSEPSGSTPSPSRPTQAMMRSSPRTEADDPSSVTTTTSPARAER
jgi:hypothetical protein